MKNFKTFSFLVIILITSKLSIAQVKKEQAPVKLVLPESYYKGQAEKRKYVESQNEMSVNSMTATTFYAEPQIKVESGSNPELRAKSMLNTTNIPSDFPSYNSSSMSEKDYESAVYKWFKANPTMRKVNN
jgi:hypothetical protein